MGKFLVISLTRGLFLDILTVFVALLYKDESTSVLCSFILPVSNNGLVPIFKFIIITNPKIMPRLLVFCWFVCYFVVMIILS